MNRIIRRSQNIIGNSFRHSHSKVFTSSSHFISCRRFNAHNENNQTKHKNERMFSKRNYFWTIFIVVGILSLGSVTWFSYYNQFPKEDTSGKKKKRVVILGSGWSAVNLLKTLDTNYYEVMMVSPRNYFLFTPLLPSTTVGTVEQKSITEPIRKFCKRHRVKCQFFEASCQDIDFQNNIIHCEDISEIKPTFPTFTLSYDYLIIAVGSRSNTFNVPGVEQYCHFLKSIEDSKKIKETVLDCFETADLPAADEAERKKLLHFLVVGGGPTGVEFAAELHDYLIDDLSKLYPKVAKDVAISLVQSGDHILNTYDASISRYAEKQFQRDNIVILTNAKVTEVRKNEVDIIDKNKNKIKLPFGMVVWSTGIAPVPLITRIMDKIPEQTHNKVLITDSFLKVEGTKNVFAVGDCSTIRQPKLIEHFIELFKESDLDSNGVLDYGEFKKMIKNNAHKYRQIGEYGSKMKKLYKEFAHKENALTIEEFKQLLNKVDCICKDLPATAQVASQQGKYLGKHINNLAKNVELNPFQYKHMGNFAYVGDNKSVAQLGGWTLGGVATWWLWRSTYWSKQVSLKCKVSLAFDWIEEKLFGRDVSRF